MTYKEFEDLQIWQEARALSKLVFQITSEGEVSKDYRFRDQIRSSSGSVADNIAEGFEREGNKEFVNFLSIAKGSCGEARSQIYRGYDNKYFDEEQLKVLIPRMKMLSANISNFMRYLKKSEYRGNKFRKE